MTFEAIYQSYWDRIYRLCMGYVNDSEWAQDIAQETFITVWQKLPQFRHESSISTWIFRIASNQCLRQIEKQQRMPKGQLPAEMEDKLEPNSDDRISFLYRSISALNETDRIIISLELEGVKQAEIAEIIGISEINVRVRIHRIKDKLTEKFKSYGR